MLSTVHVVVWLCVGLLASCLHASLVKSAVRLIGLSFMMGKACVCLSV